MKTNRTYSAIVGLFDISKKRRTGEEVLREKLLFPTEDAIMDKLCTLYKESDTTTGIRFAHPPPVLDYHDKRQIIAALPYVTLDGVTFRFEAEHVTPTRRGGIETRLGALAGQNVLSKQLDLKIIRGEPNNHQFYVVVASAEGPSRAVTVWLNKLETAVQTTEPNRLTNLIEAHHGIS